MTRKTLLAKTVIFSGSKVIQAQTQEGFVRRLVVGKLRFTTSEKTAANSPSLFPGLLLKMKMEMKSHLSE